MKKILVNFAVAIMFAVAFSLSASSANAQGRQDFLLVNNTGVEIYALYVTPHSAKDWGDDILGVDTLLAGESVEITFSRREKARYWDLRVEDEEGNYIEWDKLNLLNISKVTLYYKNGKASAIVE